MPVDLKKIPNKELLPTPPDKFRWLLAIGLCIITGAILVLSLWSKSLSTHSVWFLFCTLIIPFSVGTVGYISRLRRYENERDRVLWWNHLHQEQHEEQVLLGQQAVGVLGMSYTTPVASNKLAAALLQGGSALQTHYSSPLQTTLTTASLFPPLPVFSEAGYQSRLELILTNTLRQLQTELTQFTGNLSVRIRHDDVLKNERVLTIWQRIFPASYAVNDISVNPESDGLMWIDEWLDRQDDTLLLSVEINLFLQASNQQAESVSALLLASPAWLSRQHITPLARVHRPVVAKRAGELVVDAARWGSLTSDDPWVFWRTQVKSDVLAETLQAMDKLGYISAKKGEQVLDDTFGRPGAAVGNISLICACEYAATSGLAQWLLVGDKTTQMAVVRPA